MVKGILVRGLLSRSSIWNRERVSHAAIYAAGRSRFVIRWSGLLLGLTAIAWWLVTANCPQTEFLP